MTAVVGVLNRQAVAIAADSAVTIQNGSGYKIFNRANKIFTLSKFHPVGIMIYNEGSLMETPWETIIKVYRKEIGKMSFDSVQEYQEDFIQFVQRNNHFVINGSDIQHLSFSIERVLEDLIREIAIDSFKSISDPKELSRKFIEDLKSLVDSYTEYLIKKKSFLDGFSDEDFDEFEKRYGKNLVELIEEKLKSFSPDYDGNLNSSILNLLFHFITDEYSLGDRYTGLVFTGFGEKEFFPQLISVRISFPINDKSRIIIIDEECASIGFRHNATISPFAQKDVIETILMGIEPKFQNSIFSNFKDTNHKLIELLAKALEISNPAAAESLRNVDLNPIVESFVKTIQDYQNANHIAPLMDAVSTLSKEDLAEMAESLIYLTYLKRRITFAQESVGGPVDVAIISKGDGFIWIKRKHYFDPKLNSNFFKNYFHH
jgi:hypothetical protein